MTVLMNLFKLILVASFVFSANRVIADITVEVVDVNSKPVAGLIVYLVPLDNQKLTSVTLKPIVVNQSEKKFSPYIIVARKGMPITFSNMDDITHQIYSASPNNRFSFRIKSGSKKTIEPLVNIGKVLMGCNIHDWMSGYLLVVDTPLYAKTGNEGKSHFTITGSGRYQITVWHPQLVAQQNEITREITLTDTGFYQVKLTKEMATIPSQKNPDGFDFLEEY